MLILYLGSTDPALHLALAKIYIDDGSRDPSEFLLNNQYYPVREVGKYAESRDPHLAYIVYARGQCDSELIELTTANGMFKKQAKYLLERKDQALWESVLDSSNENRKHLINQIIQTTLLEAQDPDQVSCTVKAFMAAKLQLELIDFLEKLVFENSKFSSNRKLQNLLIITALKADQVPSPFHSPLSLSARLIPVAQSRVMSYIQRLTQYDFSNIALICVKSNLYEEAYSIYMKFDAPVLGIRVPFFLFLLC